ncbi:MAG: xanthine dehydrogenase family protein subunit M [Planctomycetota bacterium]
MRPFTYVLPKDLAEATAAAAKPDTVLKGAGIDLVDRLKERVLAPETVVNLLPLKKDLAGIAAEGDGALRLGALTTLQQLAAAGAVAGPAFGAVREAAAVTATPQVRARATLAGALLQQTRCWYLRSAAFGCLHGGDGPVCQAQIGDNRYHAVHGYVDCVRVHPSNLAPALLVLDAEYSTAHGDAVLRRRIAELFPDAPLASRAEHTLQDGEILTALHLPAQPAGARSAYRETREKQSFDWATTAAAAWVVLDGGVIRDARLVLGAVAPNPLPRPDAAKLLIGQEPSDELFVRVAHKAYADARPLTGNAYKVQVGKAVVREVLHAVVR